MNNAILMLSIAAGTAANASITDHLLYEQPSPSTQGHGNANVYYSNPTHDQIMYDQFRFDDESSIEGIGFWGALYTDSQITITIYEQDQQSGLLGLIAYQQQFASQDLNAEIVGHAWDDTWITDESHAIAEFDQTFLAQEGRTYWLAITGNSHFSWTFGATVGNEATLYSNTAQSNFWNQSDLGLDPTNLAFSIYGTAVPSPSTAILPLAALGFGLSRRRRSC